MRIRLNPRWLLVPALLFFLQISRAQVVVPPVVSFDLGGVDGTQLWDLSGNYNLDVLLQERNGLAVPLTLSFNMIQDARGRLGGGTNDIQGLTIGDNSIFAISYVVVGKVTGAGGFARAHFTVHFSGSGTLAGKEVDFMTGAFTVDAEVDAENGQLSGVKVSKFHASFPGEGTINGIVQDFVTPLPAGVDGTWNLSLQMAALNRITGTAVVTTSSKPLGFDLNGVFKGGAFRIKAIGANNVPDSQSGIGSTATIFLDESFATINLFQGKVMGQKFQFSFP